MTSTTLTVAVFPGAANAPIHLGIEAGWFAEAGIEIELIEVGSSAEQLVLWDGGRCAVMHTSPDHLIREARGRDPVIARRDGFGELSVYVRAGESELGAVRWAVDGLGSGFSFVLRALLEDRCGLAAAEQQLVAIGGTMQRFEALREEGGEVGGTTLHPPFDELARRAGFRRLAGHFDLHPELLAVVTVLPRRTLDDEAVRAYLAVLDRACAELVAGGPERVARVLERHGLSPAVAEAAATGILGPGGLGEDRVPTLAGLEAVADLRARFERDWRPPQPIERFLEPVMA